MNNRNDNIIFAAILISTCLSAFSIFLITRKLKDKPESNAKAFSDSLMMENRMKDQKIYYFDQDRKKSESIEKKIDSLIIIASKKAKSNGQKIDKLPNSALSNYNDSILRAAGIR